MQKKYNLIGMGGTFDHFHDGHKSFIDFAANLSRRLVIAVTDDSVKKSKQYPNQIQPHTERMQAVKIYCQQNNIDADVVILHDVYGPTLENSQVEALAVTTATIKGAVQINTKRDELSLPKLPVHVHTLVTDDVGKPITSTRIRAGQINRQGNVYFELLKKGVTLNMQHKLFFAQPQGEIIFEPTGTNLHCVVGDICLEAFITNNWKYDLGIYDGKSRREPYPSSLLSVLNTEVRVKSNPGGISLNLAQALNTWVETRSFKHMFVEGEEDLATVALVMILPLESIVYYGQPEQGIVKLVVTENKKEEFFNQLSSTYSSDKKPNLSQR